MIELRNVEKTYHTASGDIHALKRTSLTIEQGEIFGIIGLSGAGKSTLIRCINMLEQPTAGQVFVDGEELTAMTETQLRKARQNIGMISSILICWPAAPFMTTSPSRWKFRAYRKMKSENA